MILFNSDHDLGFSLSSIYLRLNMISRSSTSLLLLSWASLVSASPLLDLRQLESPTSVLTLLPLFES
jgi:hypothetical protein